MIDMYRCNEFVDDRESCDASQNPRFIFNISRNRGFGQFDHGERWYIESHGLTVYAYHAIFVKITYFLELESKIINCVLTFFYMYL